VTSDVERLTRRFYEWECRGRGWRSFAYPVPLEPVFVPFLGHLTPELPAIDDARKPTLLSGLLEGLFGRPQAAEEPAAELDEPVPREMPSARELAEFDVLVPAEERVDTERIARWLQGLAACRGPMAFEIVGSGRSVRVRLACDAIDASLLRGQLRAFFPAVSTPEPGQSLGAAWDACPGDVVAAIEFGLAREFMIPLRELDDRLDPLTPIVGALARVGAGEVAVLQVLFEEAGAPWRASIARAVTTPSGEPFFADAPEVTKLAEEKISSPLLAVVIRLAARCRSEEGAWEIVRSVGGALTQYGSPDRNEFVPLGSSGADDLSRDVLARRTRRSGMLLSLRELAALVRLPDESLRIAALVRTEPQEILPEAVRGDTGIVLGEARHRGADVPVVLPVTARLQHVHVIGASGTGKSTLLQSMILQDIASGAGVGVLDPHGDLVDGVLARIPPEREQDVILFDPADPDFVVGWNILGARSEIEKELLASDLVAVFKRLSTSWGDQMTTVLGNAVLAFLESSEGGTLSDLRKFLLDEAFRERFLGTVRDPHVAGFWRQEFKLLVGKKPQAPILTRLDTFLRSRLVRDVVTEREKPVDFRALVDSGKVFLAKLSQGAIGEENAALVGALLVSKFHQVSLSRQDVAEKERRPFFLYIDEFHTFATPSMASLFSGVRKYRLGLTVAHQDLYQLHASVPEVERAILANAYTRIAFRVSDEDARKLERGFADFTSEDLGNLATGQALCRVGRREDSFRLRTRDLAPMAAEEAESRRACLRERSMGTYGRARRPYESLPTPQPIHRAVPSVPEAAAVEASPAPVTPVAPRTRPPRKEKAPEVVVPEPGRGGAAHKYLQSLVKQWGEAQGFKAEIEKTIDGGKHIDIALSRDQLSIAVEIAMTTTLDWEVGNVEKALASGYGQVAVVSLDAVFLRKLARILDEKVVVEVRKRVHFFAPEEFFAFLETQAPVERTTRVAGYKVSVRTKREQASAADARKKAVAEVLLKSVRRLRLGER
jgi:hypothetical protein